MGASCCARAHPRARGGAPPWPTAVPWWRRPDGRSARSRRCRDARPPRAGVCGREVALDRPQLGHGHPPAIGQLGEAGSLAEIGCAGQVLGGCGEVSSFPGHPAQRHPHVRDAAYRAVGRMIVGEAKRSGGRPMGVTQPATREVEVDQRDGAPEDGRGSPAGSWRQRGGSSAPGRRGCTSPGATSPCSTSPCSTSPGCCWPRSDGVSRGPDEAR